jgi:hypothetical protein
VWFAWVAGSAGVLALLRHTDAQTPFWLTALIGVPLVLLVIAIFSFPRQKRALHAKLSTPEHMRHVFETLYSRELMGDSTDVYERAYTIIKDHLASVVHKFGLLDFPPMTKQQQSNLEMVRDKHCQELLEEVHRNITH